MCTGDGIVMAGADDYVSRVLPLGLSVAIFIAVMRLVASLPEAVDLVDGPSKSDVSHRNHRLSTDELLAFANDNERRPLHSSTNLIGASLNHGKGNSADRTNSEVVIRRDFTQIAMDNSNPRNEILKFWSGSLYSTNIGYTVESHLTASFRPLRSEPTQRSEKNHVVTEQWVRFLGAQENGEQENREQENGVQENGEQENGEQENGEQENGEQENGKQENGEQENGAKREETRFTTGRLKLADNPDGMNIATERSNLFVETSSLGGKARVEKTRFPAKTISIIRRVFSLETNAASQSFVSTHQTVAPKAIGVGQTLPRPSLDGNRSIDKLPQLSRSLPKAIIIGVKKCGTRALLEFLRAHPKVRATGPETHFFDKNYDLGLDWYRRQMPASRPDQMTIEKTPSYFVTDAVPGRIFRMSNDTKLIVVVRDPVTRAISHYTQVITKRPNISSFERLAFFNSSPNSSSNSSLEINASWGAIQIGLYAKHLVNWLRFFPLDQIHFVSGEGLIRDPATELEKVQDFLGLRRKVTRDQFLFSSAKKGFPCLKKFSVVSPHQQRLYCLGKNKGRSHPTVDAALIENLRRFFRPHNEMFYRMTNIDFGWP